MTIKHLSTVIDSSNHHTIYGLDESGRVYRWSHSEGWWQPFWDTRTKEEVNAVSNQFNRPSDRPNPAR